MGCGVWDGGWGIASSFYNGNDAKENLVAETVESLAGRIFQQHSRHPKEYFTGTYTGWVGKKVKSSTVDKISSTALCELTTSV
jgi:hypothetical protein